MSVGSSRADFPYVPKRALIGGLATALFCASADVGWALRGKPSTWDVFGNLLFIFALSFLFFLTIYGSGAAALALIGRAARLDTERLLRAWRLALAAAATVLITTHWGNAHFDVESRGAKIGATLAACAVLGVWIYRRPPADWIRRFPAPYFSLMLLVSTVGTWFAYYRLHLSGTRGQLICAALLAVVLLGVSRLVRRSSQTQRTALTLGVSGAAVLGGLASFAFDDRMFFARPEEPTVGAADGPPIVLLTVDTLRPDVLSFYNPEAPATPHFDRLAADAIVFRNAYSPAGWTLPAMASIFTGYSVLTHSLDQENWKLSGEYTTIAQRLRDQGYDTAAIVENPWLQPETGLSQGFNEYAHFPQLGMWDSLAGQLIADRFSTAWLTSMALDWLGRRPDGDFFLWLHLFDPHTPYDPPRAFRPEAAPPAGLSYFFDEQNEVYLGLVELTPEQRSWTRELYLAEVALVDEQLGRVIAKLEDLGLYDEALIVLTSDHGEEFWEHDSMGHGHSVFDEVIRAPLLVKPPGAARKRVVDAPLSTRAIAPTILRYAGARSVGEYPDRSLEDYWNDEALASAPIPRTPIVTRSDLHSQRTEAALFDRYKLIHWMRDDEIALFDLAADPLEQHPIEDPELRAVGLGHLEGLRITHAELRREILPDEPVERPELSEETTQRLKSLGYLQ